MKVNNQSIVNSLSGTDIKIVEHLPYLLQDLWELGGGTNRILELIERNISPMESSMILDLCCGKGAVIISIANKYKCGGRGIDLFEPFIKEAREISIQKQVHNLIDFEVLDIKDAVEYYGNYDIVIYGGDTTVLGDEIETLKKVSRCSRTKGYFLYSTVVSSIEQLSQSMRNISLQLIDQTIIDRKEIKKINKRNIVSIKQRAEELIKKYPAERKLFNDYIKSQEVESSILENNLIWVNLLLQRIR